MNTIGRFFEEFAIDEVIYHKTSKTIFESDNNLFSLLTMNHHPLHINMDYAEKSEHGQILVVGTLVFSLVVGISVPDISGKAIANLEYEKIKHLSPVFINDSIYARSKILDLIPSKSKPDRGIVYVETFGFNQKNQDVIQFRRKVLIKREKHMTSFLMRSLMFVPGHNEKFLASAAKSEADVLLLDIEDSVQSLASKQIARDKIKEWVLKGAFKKHQIFPRVNDRESGQLLKDVQQLTIEGVHGFMYPKSRKGEDVYFFAKLLETIEYEKGIPVGTFKIIPIIETAAAVLNAQEICLASDRVIAIAFGCEDFLTDLGGIHDSNGQSLFTARALIAMAAKASKVAAIDTVHIKVHDLEDLEKNLIVAKNLGFDGMLVLHPKELSLVHRYFTPSVEDVKEAKEMLRLAEEAQQDGKGVAFINGKFIGPPMVRNAKNILKKYHY